MRTAYFDHDGPIAMAHRGFSLDGLENTMVAFAAAVDLGFRYVETDVHATADGELIAFHDVALDRVTDGSGMVANHTWDQLRGLRIGGSEPIPHMDTLFGAWPDLRINIDLKAASAVEPLVTLIERHQAHDRVCVTSFSDRRRRAALRLLSRPVATSAGQSRTTAFTLGAGSRAPGVPRMVTRKIDCLQIPVSHRGIPLVTPRFIRSAHASNTQVHVWTINDTDEMHRLLDLGVDGLISDRADLLKDVLVARDGWPA
ncbi:glycerophosphodiester phosphodiesterase [Demetria terragena]|uniref:glycerophosphodiester phosphodiesterase n=1 Tax=Demetria terragena TaxID=63959 RepID=UPI00037C4F46|nr:glycerophosphodiester phosphodiesterase [Demetria terragena]